MHQTGTQAQLYNNPATMVVASLMGNPAMNFLGVTREGQRLISKEDPQIFFELSKQMGNSVHDGNQDLLLGLWPEDIQISLEPKNGFYKSQLYGQEYRGTDRIISLAVGDKTLKKMVNSTFPGRFGDDCWFSYNPENLYLFDPLSGSRLN